VDADQQAPDVCHALDIRSNHLRDEGRAGLRHDDALPEVRPQQRTDPPEERPHAVVRALEVRSQLLAEAVAELLRGQQVADLDLCE
jgi:hypothetical protein